jgi:hypothetical protein
MEKNNKGVKKGLLNEKVGNKNQILFINNRMRMYKNLYLII